MRIVLFSVGARKMYYGHSSKVYHAYHALHVILSLRCMEYLADSDMYCEHWRKCGAVDPGEGLSMWRFTSKLFRFRFRYEDAEQNK